jgi:hypothetical protein
MDPDSSENLKAIRFEGELLPNWAQLLDLGSRLCPVPEATRQWFSALTNSAGVEDSRTVLKECELLRDALRVHREAVLASLRGERNGGREAQIYAAWMYALDTMILQAAIKKTCAWHIEGLDQENGDDPGGGDITLRRG